MRTNLGLNLDQFQNGLKFGSIQACNTTGKIIVNQEIQEEDFASYWLRHCL